jgi:hypothetical protein
MHLLETYALSTGSKIKKPFILKKYFPLPFSKYITIQNSSGMSGKCYDYFQEVIDFIKPILDQNNYHIVQIGSKDDRPLNGATHLQGQTNIHQTAYILNNSQLHLGNDSFAIHMASSFGIPLIGLYSVSSPEIAGPFWKKDNQICLTPKNWRPSFNPNDNPKKINEITVENIILNIEKLLFNKNSIKLQTLYIGDRYLQNIVECTPNQYIPKESFDNGFLNVRFDYKNGDLEVEDYNATLANLSVRKCSIITDKPFDLNPFLGLKNNIEGVFYDVTENINNDFLNFLNISGFKYFLIFNRNENNDDILNQRKFETIDCVQPIQIYEDIKINIEITEKTFYKSKKIIIANNKQYISKAAYLEDKPIEPSKPSIQYLNDINDKELFLKEDSQHTFIFNI